MSFNILSQRTLLQKLLILFTLRYFYTKILHNYHLISKWRLLVDSHIMNTVNDQINARGIYFILRVQEGAFNRWEAFQRERRLFS